MAHTFTQLRSIFKRYQRLPTAEKYPEAYKAGHGTLKALYLHRKEQADNLRRFRNQHKEA